MDEFLKSRSETNVVYDAVTEEVKEQFKLFKNDGNVFVRYVDLDTISPFVKYNGKNYLVKDLL